MLRKLFHSEYLLISTILVFALLVGILVYRDYGESFDEGTDVAYGEFSRGAYKDLLKGREIEVYMDFPNLNNKGPAYFMLVSLVLGADKTLFAGVSATHSRHLVYFVTFLFGSFGLYVLARRWMGIWAANGTALLYILQPVLWGHAFINPKDTPFLSFFILSMSAGLWMCDRILRPLKKTVYMPPAWKLHERLIRFFRGKTARNGMIIWGVLAVLAWFFGDLLGQALAALVYGLYSAPSGSFWGRLFAQVAPQATSLPANLYITKADLLFYNFKSFFTVFGCLLFALFIFVRLPGRLSYLLKSFTALVLATMLSLMDKWPVLAAGILLGLTSSIRVMGPLAGLIVAVYALGKYRQKAILMLIVYALAALLVMYLTWPYLWAAPAARLFESFTEMAAFPWDGRVLFNGAYYLPYQLPFSYLPVLLLIQLTESTLVLFLIGFSVLVYELRQKIRLDLFMLVCLWFFIPASGLIFTSRTLYDNFRQILFLLPPIFLVCGAGLETIFHRIQKHVWKVVFLLLVLAPGLYGIFSLHPYEYIYYNSFIGGTRGAFQRFEMDYWHISYQEALDSLNKTAHENSILFVPIGSHLVKPRKDMQVLSPVGADDQKFDYVLECACYNRLNEYPEAQTILSIERNGAILSVIKQIPKESTP